MYKCQYISDEVSLTSAGTDPVVFPTIISLTCGQDVIIQTLIGVTFFGISCSVRSGSGRLTREIYKDGVLITNSTLTVTITPPDNDDFGTYTFVASVEGCGTAVAVSRVQGRQISLNKISEYHTIAILYIVCKPGTFLILVLF